MMHLLPHYQLYLLAQIHHPRTERVDFFFDVVEGGSGSERRWGLDSIRNRVADVSRRVGMGVSVGTGGSAGMTVSVTDLGIWHGDPAR